MRTVEGGCVPRTRVVFYQEDEGLNYRVLYFFHGREAVVLSHGLVKRRAVPAREIDLAVKRKGRFEEAPRTHTHEEDW